MAIRHGTTAPPPKAPSGTGTRNIIDQPRGELGATPREQTELKVHEKKELAKVTKSEKEKELWMKDRVVSEQVLGKMKTTFESALFLWSKMAKSTKEKTTAVGGLMPGTLAGYYNEMASTKRPDGSTKRGIIEMNPDADVYMGNIIESVLQMAKIATGGSRAPQKIVEALKGSLPGWGSTADQAYDQMVSTLATAYGEYNSKHPELFPEGLPSDFDNRKTAKKDILEGMSRSPGAHEGLGFTEWDNQTKKFKPKGL